MRQILFSFALVLALAPSALAVEHAVLKRDGRQQHVAGKLLTKAQDGGLLMLAPDGVLWAVQPDELLRHSSDTLPFRPLTADKLTEQLLKELPEGFDVHRTAHYVVCYNTSRAYAQWCGALYERLYRAFTNFWTRKGFEISEPEFPLVAVVFADADSYQEAARAELGDAARSVVGYYSLRSNRVMMYDLTGVAAVRRRGARRDSSVEINRVLSQPAAEPMVATIIHEATHQIAFNSGLHVRYAPIPLWVSEGIAIYFETPDLTSSKGWRGIGAVNRPRMQAFRARLPRYNPAALVQLVADDGRMRNVGTAADAYAEAWALTYYLIRWHTKEYLAYVQMLSKKNPLIEDDAATRLAEFQKFFGGDMDALAEDFVRQMKKVR